MADPKKKNADNKEQAGENKPAVKLPSIADVVSNKIAKLEGNGEIHFPPHYSYQNAIKSAYLILQNTVDRNKMPVLKSCNRESIINALFDMTIQGLSPVKKQCYFIPYGGNLTLMRSYFGTIAATKRISGIKDIFADVIYQGDEFEFEKDLDTNTRRITKHVQKFENIDLDNIVGAYAIIKREGAPDYVEIMNFQQIKNAWLQGTSYGGKSETHTKFSDEMAKKTVIQRACKVFFNTSDDSDLLIEAINRTMEPDDLPETPYELEVDKEIEQNANQKEIDISPEDTSNGGEEDMLPSESAPDLFPEQEKATKPSNGKGPGY